MADNKKERESVEQHKTDTLKTIEYCKNAKPNVYPATSWKEFMEIRIKCCETYLKVLEIQEEKFAHFQ